MALTFLVGGARSGKSAAAVRLASSHDGPVTFIATARAGDADMAERIERHRRERPPSWTVIEDADDLEAAIRATDDDAAVIVDCLTLWLNEHLHLDDSEVCIFADRAASAAASRAAPTIAVSNEVGSGVIPDNELVRRFTDLLGTVNATWARRAEAAYLVVAGHALQLHEL